jgi:ureidoglycolate hydrolase
VAGLNHCDIVDIASLTRVERHLETDEVFILTSGRASLIVEGGGDGKGTRGESFDVIPMEVNVVYNVKRGVYHHVVLERDASIIIVENSDTSTDNSEYRELWEEEIAGIKRSVEGIR